MRKRILASLVLVCALAAGGLKLTDGRRVVPSIACKTSGDGAVVRRVLVFGESWAAGGRLLPELPDTLAKTSGHAVRVCELGHSGENSAKLMRHDPMALVGNQLGGYPNDVVLLNGVNDQIQQRSASAYAEETSALLGQFPKARRFAIVAPIVRPDPPLPLIYRLKNRLQGLFTTHDRAAYVAALKAQVPKQSLIAYEPFSRGALAEPRRYAPDGIHLSEAVFHEYGSYIANQLD